MPKTYYDSELTGAQIESALEAIHGVVTPSNNGKVLCIVNGAIAAKSASEWGQGAVLEPLSITANGNYTPSAGVDGFSSVTVNVSGGGGAVVQPLSVTQNGTYNPLSGVDGYAPVTVNVSAGENIPVLLAITTPPTKTRYDIGDELDLTGIVVTATYADGTTAVVTNQCSFSPVDGATLDTSGDVTVTAAFTVKNTSSGKDYEVTVKASTTVVVGAVTIVSWATGTDEEIVAMLQAAHNGSIDLQTDGGWSVGDVRTISIPAFSDTYTQINTQSAQLVITSFDEYMGCGNVLQFDFGQVLMSGAYYSDSNGCANGYGSTIMKTHCLPLLVEKLPSWLKNSLIEFECPCASGNSSPTIVNVSGNKLALRSETELTNGRNRSVIAEGTWIQYYNTAEKRGKNASTSSSNKGYWTRSIYNGSSAVKMLRAGYTDYGTSNYKLGVAPFGCL